jgi:hypothetical protein
MKLPLHWANASADATDAQGSPVSFSCWRASDTSPDDAHESALAAAKRVVQKLLRGDRLDRYGYGDGALREEVLGRFAGPEGELFAAVTRNASGVMVLNTARVMFMDLDFPRVSAGEGLRHVFARLFGRAGPSPETRREQETRDRLERFLGERPDWNVRLYRTLAGLRGLVTHDLFAPTAASTLDALQAVGCDPLYVRLCKAQDCFRARLSPKPWRCGHTNNSVPWPRDETQQAQFDAWLSGYTQKQAAHATCAFLGELGSRRVHPEVERIIQLHDETTRSTESLPLA